MTYTSVLNAFTMCGSFGRLAEALGLHEIVDARRCGVRKIFRSASSKGPFVLFTSWALSAVFYGEVSCIHLFLRKPLLG